jgi:GNAT superfamily N-acetyltransferase
MRNQTSLFIFITGASGSGKTYLTQALERVLDPTFVRVEYFDRIGVPSFEDMIKEYGSCEKWHSDYPPFHEDNIPEISDLNVLPQLRQQGIGSKLLDVAETEANKKSSTVGIGVGLLADYGSAQKLYIKRGYIPDDLGITSHYQLLSWGDTVRVDDDLVLWFRKEYLLKHQSLSFGVVEKQRKRRHSMKYYAGSMSCFGMG